MYSRRKSVLVSLLLGLLGAISLTACGGQTPNMSCVYYCALENHTYYLDGKAQARAMASPDATTAILLAAGYVPIAHVVGPNRDKYWDMYFTKCSGGVSTKVCTKDAGTPTHPLVVRQTLPATSLSIGAPTFTGDQLTVRLDQAVCASLVDVDQNTLKRLPKQMRGLKPRQSSYNIPESGKIIFQCRVEK